MRRAASNPARSGDQNHGFPHLPWSKRSRSTRWLKKKNWKEKNNSSCSNEGRVSQRVLLGDSRQASQRGSLSHRQCPQCEFNLTTNKALKSKRNMLSKQNCTHTVVRLEDVWLLVDVFFASSFLPNHPSDCHLCTQEHMYMWWSIHVKGWVCGYTEQHIKYTCSEQNMDSWSYSTSICCGGW